MEEVKTLSADEIVYACGDLNNAMVSVLRTLYLE